MKFLNVIRYKNLIIMAATMALIKYCLVNPILEYAGMEPTFLGLDFAFLAIAVLLIAAGGYVINDYFDAKTDRINRPDEQIVGNSVTRGTATTWHIALSIAGCMMGMMVSYRIGFWQLGLLYPFAVGLLWFYSSAYKGMFLIGNLVVSLLVGLVPLIPVLYEVRGLIAGIEPGSDESSVTSVLLYDGIAFGAFAFVANLIREIVKDMEDVEGDTAQGCHTMPIVMGFGPCKAVIMGLIICMAAMLAIVVSEYLCEPATIIYMSVAVGLPLIYLAYRVMGISSKKDCHICSLVSKIIMIAGILYTLVMYYNCRLAMAEAL
ncbi:MAG: geranylgeranylglycerol-phosphate geranylgeranyltransferase [Bacteroidales bacterium]|nr:geranylgeranylglycerol-phosphate geranylgeranyltransferase [Bacteroidales bacterium]